MKRFFVFFVVVAIICFAFCFSNESKNNLFSNLNCLVTYYSKSPTTNSNSSCVKNGDMYHITSQNGVDLCLPDEDILAKSFCFKKEDADFDKICKMLELQICSVMSLENGTSIFEGRSNLGGKSINSHGFNINVQVAKCESGEIIVGFPVILGAY